MELTKELNSLMQEAADKAVNEALTRMIESNQGQQAQHLENCTSDARNALPEKGAQTVAKIKRRVCIGHEEDGKPIYKFVTAKSEDEFNEKAIDTVLQSARRFEVLKRNGITTEMQIPEKNVPTVGELAKMYIDSVLTTSKCPYTSHLNKHILPLFGDRKVNEVSATDISQMFAARENLSNSTLTGIKAVLSGMFKLAIEEDYIQKNPMESTLIKKIKGKPAKKREALTIEQQEEVFSMIQALPETPRLYLLLLMFTGARKCELMGLQRKHITSEYVRIEQAVKYASKPVLEKRTKSENGIRDIPLDGGAWELIKPLIKDLNPDDFVFCHKGNREQFYLHQDYQNMMDILDTIFSRYNVTAHNFRHTMATRLVEKCNGDITTVAEIIGDRVETVMGIYNHTSPEKKGKLMGKVNAALLNSGAQSYGTSA